MVCHRPTTLNWKRARVRGAFIPDPTIFNVVNAFDNSTNDYSLQDVGLDGLNSENEREFFASWLNGLEGDLSPEALVQYQADPSADDF